MSHSKNRILVRLLATEGKPGPTISISRVIKSDEEWKNQLGQKAYEILRAQGTEPPFCGTLVDNDQEGIYFCAGCALPLFSSNSKFDSGTGWPSFFTPFAQENIVTRSDTSHGMNRDEILCTRCEGHLGHVFPDGPPPTGERYCLNGTALVFREKK